MTKAEAIEYLRLPTNREYDGEHVIKVARLYRALACKCICHLPEPAPESGLCGCQHCGG